MTADTSNPSSSGVDRLLAIMRRLRDPDGGCPWDLEQSFRTIAPHTIEEAYEVADAIERGDMAHLKDELGDLLFQVVFYAQMAKEAGYFDFDAIASAISDKMIRRHPHVFGDLVVESAEAMTTRWEDQKAAERAAQARGSRVSALDGITPGLPALTRALKLQKRAARVGFDWTTLPPILDKLQEEVEELREAIDGGRQGRIEDEVGDVLFVVVNLARRLGVDPETALRSTNAKFERRFREVEDRLSSEGRPIEEASLDEMERHWVDIKKKEKMST